MARRWAARRRAVARRRRCGRGRVGRRARPVPGRRGTGSPAGTRTTSPALRPHGLTALEPGAAAQQRVDGQQAAAAELDAAVGGRSRSGRRRSPARERGRAGQRGRPWTITNASWRITHCSSARRGRTLTCMSTYLVIGGTGKTGRRVVDRLAGHDVARREPSGRLRLGRPALRPRRHRRRLPHRARPGPAQPGARRARSSTATRAAPCCCPPARSSSTRTARSRAVEAAVAGRTILRPSWFVAELHRGLPAAG